MGFFVLLSDTKNREKRFYFLSALFLGLWSLSIFFYSNPVLFDTTIWLKIVYTMAYFMTLGLILFATVYPVELEKKFRRFFLLTFVYMFIVTLIMWFTDSIVLSTVHVSEMHNTIATMGPLYILYGLPEFITAIYVVGYYIKQARTLSGIEKRQVQHYVAGGIIMLVPVLLFDFVFPLVFDNTQYYKFSTIGNSIWTIIVGYSILTTRFLDTRVVLGRVVGTFLKSIAIVTFISIVLFIVIPLWEIDFTGMGIIKLLALSVVLTVILENIFKKIESFLAEKYIYSNYNPVKSLRLLTSKNSETLDVDSIVSNLLNLINQSFKSELVFIILFDRDGKLIKNKQEGNAEVAFEDIVQTLNEWKNLNSHRILIYSELNNNKRAGKLIIDKKRESILSFMKKNSIEIIFSLRERDRFEGAVLIGQNPNRNSYTVGDIDFLDSIVQNTHISLVRAFLYLELQNFNQTLQQKVNDQTKELQTKVLELQEARRKEADMIDIMGHELRTPATVVKLNIELLQKYIHSNPANFKKYIDRISNAVETEIGLINTLLTSAKLEGDKVEIKHEKVNIQEEIEMSMHGHEKDLKAGISFTKNVQPNLPYAYADRIRVAEVLNNLLGNAIKYTEKGSITVSATSGDNNVIVSVKDTGKGIPQEYLSKLGEKFYRVDNYLESEIVRPGGTGLGLYITFGLVRLMGGTVDVKSKVGEGSTFTFTLPKYNGQKIDPADEVDRFQKLGLKR